LIQLSSSAAVIAHTGAMISDRPIFDHGDVRQSESDPSQTAEGSVSEECTARRLAALTFVIANNSLASITRTGKRLERARAIMSATTEMIATAREALARSRNLLARR
jgi:hypothetical protein